MYCIKVGRYWLGRGKIEYLSQGVISGEQYLLTNEYESGVTLHLKDLEKAELVLADYLLLNPERKWGSKIVGKPEIPFD